MWGGVVGGEGDVVARVAVFGCDFESEGKAEEGVDGWDDVATPGYGQGAILVV